MKQQLQIVNSQAFRCRFSATETGILMVAFPGELAKHKEKFDCKTNFKNKTIELFPSESGVTVHIQKNKNQSWARTTLSKKRTRIPKEDLIGMAPQYCTGKLTDEGTVLIDLPEMKPNPKRGTVEKEVKSDEPEVKTTGFEPAFGCIVHPDGEPDYLRANEEMSKYALIKAELPEFGVKQSDVENLWPIFKRRGFRSTTLYIKGKRKSSYSKVLGSKYKNASHNLKIEGLDISTKTKNLLINSGYELVGDVVNKKKELLSIWQFSDVCFRQLRNAIRTACNFDIG